MDPHFTEVMLKHFDLVISSVTNYFYLITSLIYSSAFIIYKSKNCVVQILSILSGLFGSTAIILSVFIYRNAFETLNLFSMNNRPDFDNSIHLFYYIFAFSLTSFLLLLISFLIQVMGSRENGT